MIKVTCTGNLTADPEIRSTSNNNTVCNATIACNYYDKTAENNRDVIFLKLTIWGVRGKSFCSMRKKGDPVLVSGSLKEEKWTDQNGKLNTRLSIDVDDFELLYRSQGNTNNNQQSQQSQQNQQSQQYPPRGYYPQQNQGYQQNNSRGNHPQQPPQNVTVGMNQGMNQTMAQQGQNMQQGPVLNEKGYPANWG